MFTYDENIFSDLYKDAHGFRPRNHYFYEASPEEKQVIWDDLLEVLKESVACVEEREQEAILNFESLVQKNISVGAEDREVAIRWIKQGFDEEAQEDEEYFKYLFELPYNYTL